MLIQCYLVQRGNKPETNSKNSLIKVTCLLPAVLSPQLLEAEELIPPSPRSVVGASRIEVAEEG
jgi:hypothetical protein